MELYQIREFNSDTLVELFCLGALKADEWEIRRKPQIAYLETLCRDNGVRTLVLEPEYVDRHFSDDYGGYYSKCYSLYRKKCARIHYFKADISREQFLHRLTQPGELGELGYFGFTVVKPLPRTPIGRTCVQVPAPDGCAIMASPCSANFFGLGLSVESVPFQEQDREVAACATSALWTALQATARLFEHPVPSPLQITKRALASMPYHRGTLPNNGLTIYQCAAVIRELGLEPELIDLDNRHAYHLRSNFLLKAAVGAYLRVGIPLLLAFDFEQSLSQPRMLHGVTITGAHWNGAMEPAGNFLLRSSKINRLFVHDDGVGPYAPVDITAANGELITSWSDSSTLDKRKRAWTSDLLIPLYHQIRIHFSEIQSVIIRFNSLLESIRITFDAVLFERLEWDIFLVTGNEIKEELRISSLADDQKQDLMLASMPHYLWRVQAFEGSDLRFELLFDATDLRQGDWLVRIVAFDADFVRGLGEHLEKVKYTREKMHPMVWRIVNRFAENTAPK